MPATAVKSEVPPGLVDAPERSRPEKSPKNYRGFVAGVFSGIAKLSVGHPFDTIKVRLQTTDKSHFRGPLDCLLQTLKNEGVKGIYKGATPPLVGWMFMDSIMLGSLSVYRRVLNDNIFNPRRVGDEQKRLPVIGHAMAGTMAGWTVSFIAGPVEHIKARLQVQYQAEKSKRLYSGPIDCLKKTFKNHGVRGVFHGLSATLLFRTFFCFWWGTYDVFTRAFQKNTNLSAPAINFWAGGLSAQIFWLTSYPSDVVKQRIMTDPLGPERRFPRWRDAAKAVWRESGWRGYWRGFVPCFLRAFPANAMALVAFEGVMRALPE
ncbi:mitochondrial carnitine/acylcarnitine carrier protein [Trematosphaeria pertusa]|uniref:Mitochondrial carnitine/acylcarnitine carrier protein n=1 Tax=Trematosphaeria pertusa TaxID=390896 RepID=A0A6A6IMB7_9PLEO|nr:mitochondrial carnitine/acylcarnitine carrier protein [Trematosphaeria pertusa]KAF2251228.1 mitochondrial carnitine/acylcarnitine carrier protein [Trematosphaeria pertusa]